MDTGSCLFVVSCVPSQLVVWPTGSSLVSGFGLLSVFSLEWIRAPVSSGSTSVRASLLVGFYLFLSFLLLTFSNLLVIFSVLHIAFAVCRKFFGFFWTQITWSSSNWRFYANCIFFLAISVFLPLIVSFL